MEIIQLKYFLTVTKYNHVTLAADHLCISQSSLSKHIRQLEEELGVKLFDRTARTIRLTSAGHEFSVFAAEIVAKYDAFLLKMHHYTQTGTPLRLGASPIMTQYGIHKAIHAFEKQYTDIQIEIFEEKGDQILTLLAADQIDLAIVRTATLPNNEYKVLPLIEDELVLVTNKNHPLAKQGPLPLKEAASESFIFLDTGAGLYDQCLAACAKAGFSPFIRYRHTRIETIIGFIAENAGISLLMKKAIAFFQHPAIALVDLQEPVTSTVALVFPHGRNLSPSAALFRNFLVQWFKNQA